MTNQTKSKTTNQNKRVIVVGGGLGGLAAAALLGRDGFSVSLYERTHSLGGRAACKRIAQHWLDSGFHSLRRADKGPAAIVLEKIGKPIALATKYSDGVVPKTYHNGRLADSPLSAGQLLFKYPLLSFIQKTQMMMLMQKIKKIPLDRLDHMTITELLGAAKIHDKTIIAHIKQMIAIAYYCEPNLDRISAGELARYLSQWPYDVGFPKGGWKQIIDKLQEAILENDGEIKNGKEVKRVLVSDNVGDMPKATGVVFQDGMKEEADAVILNTPLNVVPRLLDEHYLPEKLMKAIDGGIKTSGAVVMDVTVKKDKSLIKDKTDSVITLDPCIIFRLNSKYDASIAPEGHDLLSAWIPIDSTKSKDKEYLDAKFKELKEATHAVFANLDDSSTKIIRKMVFESAIGFYPSPAMTQPKRPSVIFPNVQNLYLVGDATDAAGIGACSDIAFNSALECHRAIKNENNSLQPIIV
jgi:phytoene dehydrogenase-like protein